MSKNKELNYESVELKSYDGPPYLFKVWFKEDAQPILMSGFDKQHISCQTAPKKPIKIVKIKEKN